MKPKATTMQQRMGFADPDLTTPIHDEIVLWLLENKLTVAGSIGMDVHRGAKMALPKKSQYELRGEAAARARFELEKAERGPRVDAKVEIPVKSRDYVIGFVDVRLELMGWRLSLQDDGTSHWDEDCFGVAYIEVKPTTPSFGELTRQINHYREFLPGAKFYICSPDTRFKAVLEGQGIGFIEYPATRTPTP